MNKTWRLNKYVGALVGFVMLTLLAWSLRETLTLANFTMLYILYVLIVAIRLGTYSATTAAFSSFLTINFFLTRPYYTFLVADTRDVIDLLVFIGVATLSGQLGARARLQAEVASQRAREQTILYKLTGLMNQTNAIEEVHQALNRVLLEDLNARFVSILPEAVEKEPPTQQSAATVPTGEMTYYLLLQAASRIFGTVCVIFPYALSDQQSQLVNTCVTQAAMAVHRIELAEQARISHQYEEADRLKTAILHAVSHDLRTPITIIKTSASNLQTLGHKMAAQERTDIAQGIEQEADHLNNLVGNLLDFSRLQAGALSLNLELNSLEEVAGDVAARVWQLTGQERVEIAFPEDMPLVPLDYGLFLQAMHNLIDNSLRYEPEDSCIRLEGSAGTDEVLVRIINHGASISEDDRLRMMEPFYHSPGGGHVGLGLPIAKGIIEAHHGHLDVEDTPGGGATFVVGLPMKLENVTRHEVENTRC